MLLLSIAFAQSGWTPLGTSVAEVPPTELTNWHDAVPWGNPGTLTDVSVTASGAIAVVGTDRSQTRVAVWQASTGWSVLPSLGVDFGWRVSVSLRGRARPVVAGWTEDDHLAVARFDGASWSIRPRPRVHEPDDGRLSWWILKSTTAAGAFGTLGRASVGVGRSRCPLEAGGPGLHVGADARLTAVHYGSELNYVCIRYRGQLLAPEGSDAQHVPHIVDRKRLRIFKGDPPLMVIPAGVLRWDGVRWWGLEGTPARGGLGEPDLKASSIEWVLGPDVPTLRWVSRDLDLGGAFVTTASWTGERWDHRVTVPVTPPGVRHWTSGGPEGQISALVQGSTTDRVWGAPADVVLWTPAGGGVVFAEDGTWREAGLREDIGVSPSVRYAWRRDLEERVVVWRQDGTGWIPWEDHGTFDALLGCSRGWCVESSETGQVRVVGADGAGPGDWFSLSEAGRVTDLALQQAAAGLVVTGRVGATALAATWSNHTWEVRSLGEPPFEGPVALGQEDTAYIVADRPARFAMLGPDGWHGLSGSMNEGVRPTARWQSGVTARLFSDRVCVAWQEAVDQEEQPQVVCHALDGAAP